jgi:hypothetical protein
MQIAHVGRRIDPRRAGLIEPRIAAPVPHTDHGEIRANLLLAVEQLREDRVSASAIARSNDGKIL